MIFSCRKKSSKDKCPSHLVLGFLQLALGLLVRMVKGLPVDDRPDEGFQLWLMKA